MTTPNQFPTIEPTGPSRIAIIISHPGDQEVYYGKALAGESARLLESALGHVGLVMAQCFIGNISQVQPTKNRFDAFEWTGDEVQTGIRQLWIDLEKFNPTMVLCLGNEPLHLFLHGNVEPPRLRGQFNYPAKVGKWRGSLFESGWMPGLKCMATYHPWMVLKEFGLQAYLRFDLERLKVESRERGLELPTRKIGVVGTEHSLDEGLEVLMRMKREGKPVSCDIEGTPGNVTCIAFSRSPNSAIVFPLAHYTGESVWSEEEEVRIWHGVKELMEDSSIPFIYQNGLYDTFALAWTYGIIPKGWTQDTIIAWWELYAELDKGLDVQASILTKQPFYKPDKEEGELKFKSDREFWKYNGLDAATTYECWEKQIAQMTPGQRSHYDWNMTLMPAVLYMMLRGIPWNRKRARAETKKAQVEAWKLQAMIDEETTKGGWKTAGELERLRQAVYRNDEWLFTSLVTQTLCKKLVKKPVEVIEERWQPMRWNGKKWVKGGKMVGELPRLSTCRSDVSSPAPTSLIGPPEIRPGTIVYKLRERTSTKLQTFTPSNLKECAEFIKESNKREWKWIKRLWKNRKKTPEWFGQVSTLLGIAVNVGSSSAEGDAPKFLYDVCKLQRIFVNDRKQFSKESDADHRKRLKGERVTIPYGKRTTTAQDALDKLYAETQDVRVLWCLQLRRLRKVVTDLAVKVDSDGRLRASISLIKETGRMSEKKSNLGTGMNRQALNKDLRRICVADPGCELYQCDLEGADSWTVAAECAALGDTMMLEDLKAGLKPAKVMCLVYLFGPVVNAWSRDEIKAKLEEIEMEPWLYPANKSGHHGTDYGMSWKTLVDTVLKFSMADLPLELSEAKPIVLTKETAMRIQDANHSRYPGIRLWHRKEAQNLLTKGTIVTSTGHVRRIFGRKAEIKKGQKVACHDTLKDVLSSKPQYYTTRMSKEAALRLWNDPTNRRDDGSLIVEPLLLVHDSLLTQARREDREYARAKMKEWFNNPIQIAGQEIVIPADGTISEDWGMAKKECEAL